MDVVREGLSEDLVSQCVPRRIGGSHDKNWRSGVARFQFCSMCNTKQLYGFVLFVYLFIYLFFLAE